MDTRIHCGGAGRSAEASPTLRLSAQEEADLRPLVRPLSRFTAEAKGLVSVSAGGAVSATTLLGGTGSGAASARGSGGATEISKDLLATVAGGVDLSKLKARVGGAWAVARDAWVAIIVACPADCRRC